MRPGPDSGVGEPDMQQGPEASLFYEIVAQAAQVRILLGWLRAALLRQEFSRGEVDHVEQVLAEVLNNVVEHAYDGIGAGPVSVSLDIAERQLAVTVVDEGRPFAGDALPAGELPRLGRGLPDPPEGGYGWYIFRSLAREIEYRNVHGLNILRFGIDPAAAEAG